MLIKFKKAGTVASGNRNHGGRPGKRGGSISSRQMVDAGKLTIKSNSKVASEVDSLLRSNPLTELDMDEEVMFLDPLSSQISRQIFNMTSNGYICNSSIPITNSLSYISKLQGFDGLPQLDTDINENDYEVFAISKSGNVTRQVEIDSIDLFGLHKSAKTINKWELQNLHAERLENLHKEVLDIEKSHLENPKNSDLSNLSSKEWKEKKLEMLMIKSESNFAVLMGYDAIVDDNGIPYILNNTKTVKISESKKTELKESKTDPDVPTKDRLYNPKIDAIIADLRANVKPLQENILLSQKEAHKSITSIDKKIRNGTVSPDELEEIMNTLSTSKRTVNRFDTVRHETKAKVFDILSKNVSNGADITPSASDAFSKEESKDFEALGKKINSIVNNSLMSYSSEVYIGKTNGRASYNPDYDLIKVKPKSNGSLIHEYGHHIESRSQRIRTRATNYLNSRTINEQPTSMQDIGMADEFSKRDNFISPYMGKTYSDGSTEVISMGIEYLSFDPVGFIEADEDYVRFLIWALQEG